jgi:hypothetical protein
MSEGHAYQILCHCHIVCLEWEDEIELKHIDRNHEESWWFQTWHIEEKPKYNENNHLSQQDNT